MPSVVIATPHLGQLAEEYVRCVIQTQADSTWLPISGFDTATARNMACFNFLENPEKPEFLLFADADASWHPGAVQRLMSHNLPVVTGVIFTRRVPPTPTFGLDSGQKTTIMGGKQDIIHTIYDMSQSANYLAEVVLPKLERPVQTNVHLLDEPDVQPIDGSGMHFCAIRRDVIEAIKDPWFRFTFPVSGEDFYFSRKVKEEGFQMYVDYSVLTGHVAGRGLTLGIREFGIGLTGMPPEFWNLDLSIAA